MKTIHVSDELYNKLVELSENINSQSNRATAMPYFFQVQTKKRVYVAEGCGTECWAYDGSTIETKEEIDDTISEYLECDIETVTAMSDSEKEEVLEKAGWRKVQYEITDEYENAFLTEKACKEHIRLNHYHYNQPEDYLQHAFRNPELETVYEFLCGLTRKTNS